MRKTLALLLTLTLVFTMSTTVFAGGTSADKGKGQANKVAKVEAVEQVDLQKQFKAELNAQKKEVAQAKGALEESKVLLEAAYQAALTAGDTVAADAALAEMAALDGEIAVLQAQMKQIINERYMIIKTEYSDGELAQFENAAAVIAKMYEDASVLGVGSITIKNNIIKIDSPAYIKGGRTIIPVRAITEELGATVNFDPATQTVTVSKDGVDIIFGIGSKTVLVGGVAQELDAAAEITNGRTYVPLRFIAETFGLYVDWDAETGEIGITDDTETEATAPEEETPVEEAPAEEAPATE